MTEEEIVYSIIETLNANEYNNDNKITERMVRNLIYQYRGEILLKYYSEGDDINEECFQLIELNFKRKGILEFQANAGAGVMEFSLRQGFFLEKFGVTIPVVSSMEYSLSQEEDLPLAKKIGTLITLKYQKSLVSRILHILLLWKDLWLPGKTKVEYTFQSLTHMKTTELLI